MLSEEARNLVVRIDENCKLLYEAYLEKVEYSLGVAYHIELCPHHGRSTKPKDCPCEVVHEKRVRQVRRPGLLDQLREFAANKDTDRNPKAERGAPRVKTAGRPPGDMGGFFALDELECDIPAVADRFLEAVGRDRTWAAQSVRLILLGLAGQVSAALSSAGFEEARLDSTMIDSGDDRLRDCEDRLPDRKADLHGCKDDQGEGDHGTKISDHETPFDHARKVDLAVTRWVDLARRTLKITVQETIFDKIVCGNCGGGLATPAGNRGDHDVRCVGTPTDPPCGETYPPGEWLRLYEDQQRRDGRS
jgi:hypothetical protein